jgi:hypothetical protein
MRQSGKLTYFHRQCNLVAVHLNTAFQIFILKTDLIIKEIDGNFLLNDKK